MFTFSEIQRDTVVRAAKRHITSFRNQSEESTENLQEIKVVESWLKDLKRGKQLAFLKLINHLKLYKIRKINVTDLFNMRVSDDMPMYQELAKHTKTLDEVFVSEKVLTMSGFRQFVAAMKLFTHIKKMEFQYLRLEYDFLQCLASVLIGSLNLCIDPYEWEIQQFLSSNPPLEELRLVSDQEHMDISDLITGLKGNTRLKVHFSAFLDIGSTH